MIVLLGLFGIAVATRTDVAASGGDGRQRSWTGASDQGAGAGLVPGWQKVVASPAASREELLGRLYQITEAAPGGYGIYIYELDSGQGFGIDADTRFEAASTNKIPILIKLYQEIALGNVSRDQVMTYLWSDFEEGSGSIQAGPVGSEWTVAELAAKMMKESDNVAKNMLFRLLGYSEVESLARELGADFDVYYNQVTPRGMADLLRQIYENAIVDAGLSREMIGLMIDTGYEDRLPRHLDGVPVAHKIGTWGDAVSDAGIVLDQRRPFVICVYSHDTGSEAAAADAIALIAAETYAYEVNR